jgi:hypothetical protein
MTIAAIRVGQKKKWRCGMAIEFKLLDRNGRTVTVAPLDLVERYLKHNCPDGDYAIEGLGEAAVHTNCTLYRIGGIVYPSSGVRLGVRFDPRSREECEKLFGKPEG